MSEVGCYCSLPLLCDPTCWSVVSPIRCLSTVRLKTGKEQHPSWLMVGGEAPLTWCHFNEMTLEMTGTPS